MQIDIIFPNQNRHVRYLLGLYIKRKRYELGLDVKEVAAHFELSPQSYRKIESGHVKVDFNLFEKMRTFLSLDSDDLIEIHKIASVKYINDLSKALFENYPA